jgi:hypothetical protein
MQTKSNIQLIIEQNEYKENLIATIEKYLKDNNIEQSFLLFENLFDPYNGTSYRIDTEVINAKKDLQGFSMVPDKYLSEESYYTCLQSYHKPFGSIRELIEELYSEDFNRKYFDSKTKKYLKPSIGIGIYDNREIHEVKGEKRENNHQKQFYLMEYNIDIPGYGNYLKESGLENNHKVKIIMYNPVKGYIYL